MQLISETSIRTFPRTANARQLVHIALINSAKNNQWCSAEELFSENSRSRTLLAPRIALHRLMFEKEVKRRLTFESEQTVLL